MKIIFVAMMCIVLDASQCFAISGGPVYTDSATVVGTYAGVMQPTATTDDCGQNSLGVFSVGVPQTGLSSGAFVMFSQGRVFTGTVRGTGDPGQAALRAVLDATFDFTVTRTIVNPFSGEITTTTTAVTATANGILDAAITHSSRSFSTASTRLRGSATLDISQGQVDSANQPIPTCRMNLSVIGFKQSDTAPAGT